MASDHSVWNSLQSETSYMYISGNESHFESHIGIK